MLKAAAVEQDLLLVVRLAVLPVQILMVDQVVVVLVKVVEKRVQVELMVMMVVVEDLLLEDKEEAAVKLKGAFRWGKYEIASERECLRQNK